MDSDVIKLLVAIIGFAGGVVALITAVVSRRKEIVNRQEIIHRHEGLPTGTKAGTGFVCPHCAGSELQRTRGVQESWQRLVLFLLLAWPIPFLVIVALTDRTSPQPAAYLCFIPVFMVPGFIYWWLIRRPLLRCEDCGAKVLARDARG